MPSRCQIMWCTRLSCRLFEPFIHTFRKSTFLQTLPEGITFGGTLGLGLRILNAPLGEHAERPKSNAPTTGACWVWLRSTSSPTVRCAQTFLFLSRFFTNPVMTAATERLRGWGDHFYNSKLCEGTREGERVCANCALIHFNVSLWSVAALYCI